MDVGCRCGRFWYILTPEQSSGGDGGERETRGVGGQWTQGGDNDGRGCTGPPAAVPLRVLRAVTDPGP